MTLEGNLKRRFFAITPLQMALNLKPSLPPARANVPRVNNLDACVTGKVRLVEGQNMRDIMHAHRGCETGVVDLNTADAISLQSESTIRMDLFIYLDQRH